MTPRGKPTEAQRIADWIEAHVTGQDGQCVILKEWQRDALRKMYDDKR